MKNNANFTFICSVKSDFGQYDAGYDMRVGDVVTFNIIRDGEEKSFAVTVDESYLRAF